MYLHVTVLCIDVLVRSALLFRPWSILSAGFYMRHAHVGSFGREGHIVTVTLPAHLIDLSMLDVRVGAAGPVVGGIGLGG